MHPVIYDVAVSIDGFISGRDGDISGFAHAGPVVDAYQARLQTYATAIMGRATYTFGYRYGLAPGQNPYPHMKTLVFSQTLEVPDDAHVTVCRAPATSVLPQVIAEADAPIYLCGGGAFAGALAHAGLIEILRIKRAPIVLGQGVRLFGPDAPAIPITCRTTRAYDDGYIYQEFDLKPSAPGQA